MPKTKNVPMISSKIFGSNAINNIPKKDEKIKNHFLLLILSLRKRELIKIAKGIES